MERGILSVPALYLLKILSPEPPAYSVFARVCTTMESKAWRSGRAPRDSAVLGAQLPLNQFLRSPSCKTSASYLNSCDNCFIVDVDEEYQKCMMDGGKKSLRNEYCARRHLQFYTMISDSNSSDKNFFISGHEVNIIMTV